VEPTCAQGGEEDAEQSKDQQAEGHPEMGWSDDKGPREL